MTHANRKSQLRLKTLGRVSAILLFFCKEDNFCDPHFAFLHNSYLQKRGLLEKAKRKGLAIHEKGSTQERKDLLLGEVRSIESVSFPLNPCTLFEISFEPVHIKTYKMACVPSEDSDQPGHLPSLIRVSAVCMKKAWVLSCPLSAQQRLGLDWWMLRLI